MGLLDDTIRQLTQGGGAGQTSPLAVVIQELILGKAPTDAQAAPPQQAKAAPAPQAAPGGELGGLGALLAQLQAAGLGDAVKSWVGTGQNQPVEPEDLGTALGPKTVTKMADKAGCSQDDLLTQLSKALPGLIDKLTADGRIPTQAELADQMKRR
jgi:uncharacterized protein YidB (DUF937 family)